MQKFYYTYANQVFEILGNSEINNLFFVAVFLDPCYKLEYVEFCFGRLYGKERSQEMIKRLREIIEKLLECYVTMYPLPINGSDFGSILSSVASQPNFSTNDDNERDWENEFRMKIINKQGEVKRNEMDGYIEDDVEDSRPNIEFEILKWWRMKLAKYYILSRMARDILAIPMSIVSSESAFSIGSRVLDLF